jgi:hypothetical protein
MLHFHGSKLKPSRTINFFLEEWLCECNEMMILLMVGHEVALWVLKDNTQ